jgi:signal transduction histidine kinase
MIRRNLLVYGLLMGVWLVVFGWQIEEHARFRESAKEELRNRSKDIANTVCAIIRSMRFRGAIPKERIEPVLNELINGRTNNLVTSSELISIALLNASSEPVASAGRPLDSQGEDLQQDEYWRQRSVILVNPVDLGASVSSGQLTNTLIIEATPPPRTPPTPPAAATPTNVVENPAATNSPAAAPRMRDSRRPGWARAMSDQEFQLMVEKRRLHGVALALSTDALETASSADIWMRTVIMLLATVSVIGSGMAWRYLAKLSDLQLRLVRTSELNSHLREMNLAAAGLAHETRNPLNIIRGLAQMISKEADTVPGARQKSREIVDEADKVAAQLNEFINYSRPREVRRSVLSLGSVVNEVVRALGYDLEEKQIRLQVKGEQVTIEADEQFLRQALFNLILNAIQAVNGNGEIEVLAQRASAAEALIEIRDNGPGVAPENRTEIFKPYFTTQKTGTGLGLAVVQQIVLAHGWEIECLPNTPTGAIFRISHVKLAAR